MTLLFWLLFVPVVAFLFLEAFVVLRLCDRVSMLEQDASDRGVGGC